MSARDNYFRQLLHNKHYKIRKTEDEIEEATKKKIVENDIVVTLGNRKRVQVQKGTGREKILIDIREYFRESGRMKGVKFGVTYTLKNWNKLKSFVKEIDETIQILNK